MVKAEVCKTSIHRFDSDRRLSRFSLSAGVAELVDARDLKSLGYFITVPVRFRPSALSRHRRTLQIGSGLTTALG